MDALTAAASSTTAMDSDRDELWTTSSTTAMTTTSTTLSPALSAGEAENIAVCIRVRPLNEREVRARDCNVLRTISAMNMISITDVDGAPLSGKHNVFQYDHIYDETSSTKHMYSQVAKRIVRSTLEGINGTIFAYGQTSSGKTYTMQGNGEMPFEPEDSSPNSGILQLAVEDIFNYIESCDDRDFLLRVSFVEIYNEVVKDLLTSSDKGNNLKLREDPRKGVYVECKEEIITNYEDILNLLAQGNMRRTVGQTAMNERSSRSHSIFRIVIESKQKSSSRRQSEDDVTGAVLVACLSLVDLAGSESVRHTAAEGIRQREAGNINKSLLTLSRVINSLASASSGGQNAPFRDSKLTRLLQNSLDGNTRTLIICCVTPSDRYLDETKSTLQFAARAKDIQTSASVNEVLDDQAQLKRLKREVHELKKLVNNEALNALKAENEALMHEKSRHKEEYARLMGLILTSTTRTRPSSDSKVKQRVKRTRETWCPGDFPTLPLRDLENTRSAAGALSPNPQPRKRRSDSDAKENIVPQNLLNALEEEMDDDTGGDTDGGGRRSSSNSKAHVLSSRLLTVFELALQNYRGDNDENYRELNDAIEDVHELATREEDKERLSELLQDLKSLVDMSANSEHLRGENELLNMEVEELHRKLNLLENPSMSSQDDDQSIRDSLEALKVELTETQASLEKERELVAELLREKQIAKQMAAEESKVLVEQVEGLRMEVDEKQAMFGAEKQSLETALSSKADELTQLQSELSRQLELAFAEIEEHKLLRIEEVGRLEKELFSKNAKLEEQAAAFKELEAGIQKQQQSDDSLQKSKDQENENLRDERDTLESMLREMEEARNTLQVKVSQLEEELKSSQQRNEQGQEETNNSMEEVDEADTIELSESLEAQNQRLISERASLTEAMMALEEQLQQTAKYHSDLDAQVRFLIEEKTALTEKVSVLENELAQPAGKKASRRSDTNEQDVTMEFDKNDGEEGLSSELQKLLQEMSKLQFELEQATTEKQAVMEQLKSLSSVKEQYDEHKRTSGEELERLRTELEYAANEKQASDINIQDLNEERAQLAEAIRAIKFEMDHLLGENNRKADRLELEVIDLRVVKEKRENETASLKSKLEVANEEMSRLKKKLVEFDEDKQSLLATVSSMEALESKLQNLLSERESHSAQVSGLESKLEALSLENARLAEKIQEFSNAKLIWLQKSASSEDLQEEIGAMQEEQSRLSLLVEEFETRLASKTDENEQNLIQVSKLAAEIVEYESTVADQSTAIEQLRAELSLNDEEQVALQSRIDELSLLEEQVAELEHENAQLKGQQVQVNGTHGSKMYELEEAKIQAEVQLSELESENAKLLEQLSSMQQGGGEFSSGDQTQLFEKLTALENEKQKLAAELEQVSSQRSELLDELSALEAQLMEESQEKMRLTTAFDELEKKLRDIRRSSGDNSENVSDLQSELQRAQQAESTLVNELEKLTAAVEKLEAENKSLKVRSSRRSTGGSGNEDLDALHQRLEIEGELRATLELDVKSYEETLHVLRNELKDSSDTITDLLEKLKAMEVDIEHLTQVKEKAERETEIARELMQRAKEEQNELRFQNQQRVLSSEQKDRSLCDNVESLEQQLKEAKQTIQGQQAALENQSLQRIEASENNSNSEMLKKTVADLQDQLLESRKALAVQEDTWKSKQSGAEKQFAQLTSDLDNKVKEISRLSQVLADAQNSEQELSFELTNVKRAYTELLQRKEELEQQLNEVDSQWRAREEELGAKVSAELLSVKKAYSEVVLQKEHLEQQLSVNDSQWRAKEQALNQQVAAEMDSLREQYQEAQEELDSYQKYADDEIHKLRASVESNDLEMAELSRASQAKEEELNARLKEQENWVSHLKTKHEELEAENSDLYAERKILEGKLETLLSSRDDAVDQLENELRDVSIKHEQAEAKFSEASEHIKEIKSTMEKLEGEAYQHRNELEDMSESLKSSQMEAMHYHNQLIEVQVGKEELEKLVETQKKRIDKLEKVKMTTETLDLFRKLKKDREELQIKVQALQQELIDVEKASAQAKESSKQQTTRLVQRKEEELGTMREHIAELEQAVEAEKEKAAMMKFELKTTIRDVMDKSQQEIRDMQDVLRGRATQMEQLEQQVSALAQEKTEILAQKSGNVTYLEKENLELLVENRQLKKRLESSAKSTGGSSSSRVASALEDMPDYDESAAAASAVLADSKSSCASDFETKSSAVESKSSSSNRNGEGDGGLGGFLLASKDANAAAATKEEDEEEARPACAQQ